MIGLETRGLAESIRALERGAESFVPTVVERTVQRLTLEGRQKLFQKMSGETVDRGFWGRGSPAGDQLGVRSGNTRRKLTPGVVYRLISDHNVVIGSVGSEDPHVKALETGETIHGKGKLLRQPTVFAQTATGVDRNAGRSMKGVPGTAIFKSKAGNLFIWAIVSKTLQALATAGMKIAGTTRGVAKKAASEGKTAIPLYMLVPEVKMPEKRLFGHTAIEMQPRAEQYANANAEVWVQALASAGAA